MEGEDEEKQNEKTWGGDSEMIQEQGEKIHIKMSQYIHSSMYIYNNRQMEFRKKKKKRFQNVSINKTKKTKTQGERKRVIVG